MIPALLTITSLVLSLGDFPICEMEFSQLYPDVLFADSLFYVFWSDYRYMDQGEYCIYVSRIQSDGTVIDSDGKLLYRHIADTHPSAAFDGTNLLVVFQDSC